MNGNTGLARGKRKASDSPDAPPTKRAVNGMSPSDDGDYDVEYVEYEDVSDMADAEMLLGTPTSLGEWQDAIQKVVRNVVAIRFCQTCSFDTDPALTSEATGFVVDAERGYIMTNRHVVGPGPFWGYCVFDNHEEVDCYPVYRDPVHDFGILRYDPKAIKYMTVDGLDLRPEYVKGTYSLVIDLGRRGEVLCIFGCPCV